MCIYFISLGCTFNFFKYRFIIKKIGNYGSVDSISKHPIILPWLVWLSGLNAGLRPKGSPLVRCPVRAHAWVAGQVSSRERQRGNHTVICLSHSPSLSKNKLNLKKKKSPITLAVLCPSPLCGPSEHPYTPGGGPPPALVPLLRGRTQTSGVWEAGNNR